MNPEQRATYNAMLQVRNFIYENKPSKVFPWLTRRETDVIIPYQNERRREWSTNLPGDRGELTLSTNRGNVSVAWTHPMLNEKVDICTITWSGLMRPIFTTWRDIQIVWPTGQASRLGHMPTIEQIGQRYMVPLTSTDFMEEDVDFVNDGVLLRPVTIVFNGADITFDPSHRYYQRGLWWNEDMSHAIDIRQEDDQIEMTMELLQDLQVYAGDETNLVEWTLRRPRLSAGVEPRQVYEAVLPIAGFIWYTLRNPYITKPAPFDWQPLEQWSLPEEHAFTYRGINVTRANIQNLLYAKPLRLSTQAAAVELERLLREEKDPDLPAWAWWASKRTESGPMTDVLTRYEHHPELGARICTTCNQAVARYEKPQTAKVYCSHRCFRMDGEKYDAQ